MQDLLQEIEDRLKNQNDFHRFPEGLYEPMRYILQLPAKRVRPLLCLLSYQVLKPEFNASIYDLALSVEYFHNFTLIHDDIMDQAQLRRGVPTVHKKYNLNTAILAGDNLFAWVYAKMVNAYPDKAYAIIHFFSPIAIQVCEGQMYDLILSEKHDKITIEEYLQMIKRKTAVLIGGAMGLGAIAADAPEEIVQKFYQVGEFMGMGFQLQDDYLDAFADEQFGKKIGGDILANKKTFLLISALQDATPSDYKELQHWLNQHQNPEKKIAAVKALYEKTEADKKCLHTSNMFFQQAYQLLEELKAYGNIENLQAYLRFLQNRKK